MKKFIFCEKAKPYFAHQHNKFYGCSLNLLKKEMKQNQSILRIRNNIKWFSLTLRINIGLVSRILFSSLPPVCRDFITAGIRHWMTWQSAFSLR